MHPNETVLNDYVDEALGSPQRADVERHLGECAGCRALVADLQAIRTAARTLDLREPPVRAWSRIERAIRLEREHQDAGARKIQPSGGARAIASRSTYAWLAAAAAIVIAVSVGIRYRPSTSGARTPVAGQAVSGNEPSAAVVEAELRAAEEHYDRAIKGLEQITNADKGALDTQTAATLQKNLAVIDQAIDESRAAVRAQPASEPAQQSLIDSFKAKLALLQDTVALINEMRKGDQAGAARIGSGLRQKG